MPRLFWCGPFIGAGKASFRNTILLRDASKEAAEAGIWQTKSLSSSKHPRLQILTIEDLLAGKKIDMPAQQEIRSFKQAPKAKGKKTDDQRLF